MNQTYPNPPRKKLYRSRSQRMIAGVCGGMADYFNMEVTWIRLIFIILLLGFGSTLLIYIILWVIVPEAPDNTTSTFTTN